MPFEFRLVDDEPVPIVDLSHDKFWIKLMFADQQSRRYEVRAATAAHALWQAGQYAVHMGMARIVAMEIEDVGDAPCLSPELRRTVADNAAARAAGDARERAAERLRPRPPLRSAWRARSPRPL
jgi:hypothetical protein